MGGSTQPTNADTCILDDWSGNVTVDTTTCVCRVLDCVSNGNYAGVLTFTAGQILTFSNATSSTCTFSTTMTTAGTGKLTFSGTAPTINFNGVTMTGSVNFSPGGTTTLSSALNITGTVTFVGGTTFSGAFNITCGGLTFSAAATYTLSGDINCNGNMLINTGSVTINGHNINVTGNLTLTGFSILLGSTTIVNLTGTGTWSHSTSALFVGCSLVINTAGTITLGANVGTHGTVTYTAGTVDATTNSSILNITAAATLNTNGMSWYNILINGTTMTLTLGSNLTCINTLTLNTTVLTQSGAFDVSCANFLLIGATATTWNMTSGQTLNITNSLIVAGPSTIVNTFKAVTASTPFNLNYTGSAQNCDVSHVTFTDVNATGKTIYNYNGAALTRTTNIKNVDQRHIGGIFVQ